jgi:hydroxypyruvate reductase
VVRVTGGGTGGRNQEFALALAPALRDLGPSAAAASAGTDGVDGPTDAAGAMVDGTTLARAAARRLDVEDFLARNDSYTFFDRLGDLIRTGPTGTNVGDLQVVLAGGGNGGDGGHG